MQGRHRLNTFLSFLLSFFMVISLMPVTAVKADTVTADYTAKLTFSDSGIEETSAGSGYEIDGTTLTITAAGTYDLAGSCSEGAVVVDKALSGVVLMLDGLTLASSSTAPIIVKKQCSDISIHLVDGTKSTITNNEDPTNEDSTDTEVADAFEGACIKVKTDSSVVFCGGGSLICEANTKNGIKGGTNASITFNSTGTIIVCGSYSGYATTEGVVNNGIASDGSLTFNAGTYVVDAANDGIKAVPDSDDTTSAGDILINDGTFYIKVDGDAIQAEQNLTINGGTFDIKTMTGYLDSNYDEDTMSCKGIKASGDREDIENTITITGGDFTINTVDDAVHSDMYATVTGGSFYIKTGDDGMHADTSLVLGTSDGYERDPDIYIEHSYEGLEAGTVYIYSGRHYVYATDDGVNAAGGSSSGSDAGQGGGNSFMPGGGGPGSSGGGPGQSGPGTSGSSDYNLYIYGGELYVSCHGDGLDSNGGLYLYGGKTAVFSQASGGDNSPCDTDGSWVIDGGTLFAAGTNSMNETPSNSQKYYTSTTSRSAGTNLSVSYSNTVKYSCTLPRAINYLLYSDSDMTSTNCSVSAGSLTSCANSAWRSSWEHDWDSGSTDDAGVTTYTCSTCRATEKQTEAASVSVDACDHSVEVEETSEVTEYTATFSVSNASINIYYTQDYTTADETGVTTAVARDGDTGDVDVSGSGQINFTIVPDEGYAVDSVAVTGSYKNLKGPSDTGISNTYRITKVAGDLTIEIVMSSCEHENVSAPTWTWESDYSAATASFVCSDCGSTVEVEGIVTSELTDSSTITFTASAEIGGTTYTDSVTAEPYTGTFTVVDEDGNVSAGASVNSYYTQDYTAADETDVTTVVARDSDTGCPVLSGGQINFGVVPADGYEVVSVSADANYKNLKEPADTGADGVYRLTKVSGDVNITIVVSEAAESGITVTGATGSFNDQIKLNFYLTVSDDYELPEGAYVEITGSACTGTVSKTFADAAVTDDEGNVSYKVSIPLVAKEVSDTITLKAYDSDGNSLVILNSNDDSGYGCETTLMTYLEWLAEYGSTAAYRALGAAAIDYCKAAKIYFEYNADGLTLSDNVAAVSADDLIDYKAVGEGTLPTGVTLSGLSAMIEADNTLRVYLDFDGVESDSISYKIDEDDTTLKTRSTDGALYLALDDGVYSDDLQVSHDYHIGDYTLTASVLTYARLCILNSDEDVQNLGKALYLYNQAADACF